VCDEDRGTLSEIVKNCRRNILLLIVPALIDEAQALQKASHQAAIQLLTAYKSLNLSADFRRPT
jgi:hypothetical protein